MSDVPRLDLEQGRSLRALLATAVAVYRDNVTTVLAVTGAIVVTVNVIIGLGLNEFGSHYRSDLGSGAQRVQLLVSLLVLGPLINATAAQLVFEVSEGRRPQPMEVLQRGLDVFAHALFAAILYWVAVVAGLFVLVLPGIYVGVLWYFATQTVTIEGRRGFGALQRSGELVSGHWFRVAGVLLVINLVTLVPAYLLGLAVDAAAKAADAEVVSLAGGTVIELFTLSFAAIAAALLFFDLRARRAGAVRAPSAP